MQLVAVKQLILGKSGLAPSGSVTMIGGVNQRASLMLAAVEHSSDSYLNGHSLTQAVMSAEDNEEFVNAFTEFQREAWLMSRLQHPHIVQLFGICVDPPAMIMELVPQGDLYHLLEKGAEDRRLLGADRQQPQQPHHPQSNRPINSTSVMAIPAAATAASPPQSLQTSVSSPEFGVHLRNDDMRLLICLDIARGSFVRSFTAAFSFCRDFFARWDFRCFAKLPLPFSSAEIG